MFTNWKYDRNQNLFVTQPCKNCEPGKFNKDHGMVSWSLHTHSRGTHWTYNNIAQAQVKWSMRRMSFPRFNLALNQVWIRISFVSWPWLFTGDKGHGGLTWEWILSTKLIIPDNLVNSHYTCLIYLLSI